MKEQLERLNRAATRYFQFTDDADAMHISDVLTDLLQRTDDQIEDMIRWYEEESDIAAGA